MATVNISALFENNLRKVSEVGVAELNAVISVSGDRLGQGDEFAKGGDKHLVYTIPADSIASKIYLIVDEAFSATTKVGIKTIVDGKVVVAALDATVKGMTVSVLVDTYFEKADGFELILTKDATVGKLRVVAEYISASTNNGIYVDVGA